MYNRQLLSPSAFEPLSLFSVTEPRALLDVAWEDKMSETTMWGIHAGPAQQLFSLLAIQLPRSD